MAAILELEDAIRLDILRRLPAWPFHTAQHGVASVCVAWRALVASIPYFLVFHSRFASFSHILVDHIPVLASP